VLRCELPDQPVVVVGDDLRLQQVLYNLVSNAIKYSPSQAEVLIRITQVDETASIIVVDQGIGIPAESLPHLFQRFYRASNVDPQHISGMGIGLYVVKEIVTLHGGEITVESAENTGSTFTVRLPLAKT
jgi:signal transduction histidine kinase